MERGKFFAGLSLVNFAITLGFGMADAFFSVYFENLGARGLMLASAIGLCSCAKIFLSPVMGALSDRFDYRTLIFISLLLYITVSFCYLIASSLLFISFLRLIQGIGFAIFRPVVLAIISQYGGEANRGRTIGTFDMSFYGALALGPVLGGLIKDHWGYSGIYFALLAACVTAGIVAFVCIPRNFIKLPIKEEKVAHNILSDIYKLVRYRSPLQGLIAFIFGRSCAISVLAAFLPIMLISEIGMSGIRCGVIMASSTIVFVVLLRGMGMLADKVNKIVLIASGSMGVSLLLFLIPFGTSFLQLLALIGSVGLMSVLSQPASTSLLLEEGKIYGSGFAIGVFQAALNIGSLFGPIVGSLVYDWYGLKAVFYISGMVGLVSVFIFLRAFFYQKRAILSEARIA